MSNLVPSRNGRRLGTLHWDPMRVFDDLMTWEPPGSETVWSAFQSPVNVTRTDDGATITVDMPGVDPNDLELTYDNGTLAIAGKRGERTYRYKVALGDTIDPDTIEAKLDKGAHGAGPPTSGDEATEDRRGGYGQGAGTWGIEVIL